MMFQSFQIILMPVSFGLLFSLMLLYWGQAALFSYTKYTKLTRILFFCCIAALTFLLICRFLDSGHLPLSNLYESLLFLSWSFLIIQLGLQINCNPINSFTLSEQSGRVNPDLANSIASTTKSTDLPAFNGSRVDKGTPALLEDQFIHFVGVITSPLSFLTYTFAFLNLPKEMQKATALVPALQSNWLMMHVTVMILSYAALLCGSLLSMAFLFVHFFEKRNVEDRNLSSTTALQSKEHGVYNSFQPSFENENGWGTKGISSPKQKWGNIQSFSSSAAIDVRTETHHDNRFTRNHVVPPEHSIRLSLAEKLDNYSYRILALGFPLLTVGILSGAVWANQAWGSYWSWDPKESWALITWLVFAIYLHARITKGWSGQKPAIVATVGFFAVWFCYLGVNILGTGLHSYGWFSK